MIIPRGRHKNDRNREVIPNPRRIQRPGILSWENTRCVCWVVAFPTLSGVALYKSWHMRYTCFWYFPLEASHIHPVGAIVNKVAAAMVVNRATRAATAEPN